MQTAVTCITMNMLQLNKSISLIILTVNIKFLQSVLISTKITYTIKRIVANTQDTKNRKGAVMNHSIDYPAIGARIRLQRERIGMTQEQFGEACGLSASFIGHIERGSRKLSVESLYRLASVLNVSTDYLLFDRMTQETSLPQEIASLLQGSDKNKRQSFWRITKLLAEHLDEL